MIAKRYKKNTPLELGTEKRAFIFIPKMFLLNFVNFICQWDKICTTKDKHKTSNKTVLSALLALQSKSNLASLLIGDYLNSTGLG